MGNGGTVSTTEKRGHKNPRWFYPALAGQTIFIILILGMLHELLGIY